MSFDLTGQKVSFTYGNLVQYRDSSFYDGFGNPIIISNSSSGSSGVSQSYVDASLIQRDVSISNLQTYTDASLVLLKTYDDARWIDINRNGFLNQTDTSISFDPSLYVFTLSSTGSSWKYIRGGIEYTIMGDVSVQLPGNPPSTAVYYITIDSTDGTLTQSTTVWTLMDQALSVASIRFDSTNTPTYFLAEERHTALIDTRMHYYLHNTIGTRYISGGVLNGPKVTGSDSSDNCFGVLTNPIIADEDIVITLPTLVRPSDVNTNVYTVFYRTSPSVWDWVVNPVPYTYAPGSFIQWDNNGVMTTGTNTQYYNWYIVYTDKISSGQYIMIPGRGNYNTLTLAQQEDPKTFDFSGLGIAEYVIAYQLTYQARNGNSGMLGSCRLAAAPVLINEGVVFNTSSTIPNGVTQGYVDGSLGARDASITDLYNNKLNIVDASNNYAKYYVGLTICTSTYTLNPSDNGSVVDCSGTFLVNLPNTFNIGFSSTIFNSGIGTVTLNASTLLSINSSVNITTQYSAASVIYKGSNTWYAFGNLN